MAKLEVKKSPGGYILIDLGGLYIGDTDDFVDLPGIYDVVEKAVATGKPVYISGYQIEESNFDDLPAGPLKLSSKTIGGEDYRCDPMWHAVLDDTPKSLTAYVLEITKIDKVGFESVHIKIPE